MSEAGQSVGEPVDEQFGAARRGIAEIAMGEEDDTARLWGERRRVRRVLRGRREGVAQ